MTGSIGSLSTLATARRQEGVRAVSWDYFCSGATRAVLILTTDEFADRTYSSKIDDLSGLEKTYRWMSSNTAGSIAAADTVLHEQTLRFICHRFRKSEPYRFVGCSFGKAEVVSIGFGSDTAFHYLPLLSRTPSPWHHYDDKLMAPGEYRNQSVPSEAPVAAMLGLRLNRISSDIFQCEPLPGLELCVDLYLSSDESYDGGSQRGIKESESLKEPILNVRGEVATRPQRGVHPCICVCWWAISCILLILGVVIYLGPAMIK